ncbi:MAG: glycosyltransferase family 4 protein [Bacteroidales bacterium]|nr:glycosyltransferase family 4 protein [Bacteroidales bacterium]
MNKSKYLIIGKLPPPFYGTSVWFSTLYNNIKLKNYGFFFYNISINSSIKTLSKFSTSKIFLVLKKYIGFKKLLSQRCPKVVLIPLSQSLLGILRDSYFIRTSVKKGCLVLLILHGSNLLSWYKRQNTIIRKYVNLYLSKAEGALVLGNNLKYIFEHFLPSEKIYVVPNGLNIEFPVVSKNKSVMQLLYLGNLQHTKGITDIIEALTLIDNRLYNKFRLDVVGSWREKSTKELCFKMISRNNLPVKFLGSLYHGDKNKVLAGSDVLIFTPRAPEGHPLVIIEAMAAGLPVISTDQGAITELVINGVNGFIVEKQNPESIASKIKYFIGNETIRKKMGKESRRIYEQEFTEDIMVDKLIDVFDSVLESNE